MSKLFVKVFIALVVVTVALVIVGFILYNLLDKSYYLPVFPYMLFFFFMVNAIVQYFKLKIFRIKATSFPRHLMAINGAKIFVYVIYIFAYFFSHRENAQVFLIVFLFLYFVYFIFDLVAIRQYSKNEIKQ